MPKNTEKCRKIPKVAKRHQKSLNRISRLFQTIFTLARGKRSFKINRLNISGADIRGRSDAAAVPWHVSSDRDNMCDNGHFHSIHFGYIFLMATSGVDFLFLANFHNNRVIFCARESILVVDEGSRERSQTFVELVAWLGAIRESQRRIQSNS